MTRTSLRRALSRRMRRHLQALRAWVSRDPLWCRPVIRSAEEIARKGRKSFRKSATIETRMKSAIHDREEEEVVQHVDVEVEEAIAAGSR